MFKLWWLNVHGMAWLKLMSDSMSQYSSTDTRSPLTLLDLAEMKQKGEKIVSLTAYDASFSAVLDDAGVEVLLVGDSLGMVVQGHASTLPVTVGDMVYHCRCVAGARQRAFIIADMPFMSYPDQHTAALNAGRLMAEGRAQMIKLEGARIDIIAFLVDQGVPVCAHLGLLPQSINQLGRYRVQGRDDQAAEKIFADACAVEQAGASLLVLECVPSALATRISRHLSIPVIGIGAGADCDGQVLVLYDMLDIGVTRRPRFSKNFLAGTDSIAAAVKCYSEQVKARQFPGPEHCYL